MNYPTCHERLIELLKNHIGCISEANDYLVIIKDAIAKNKLEMLQQTLSSPVVPMEAIEKMEQQRYQLLADYGFSEDRDGFEECLRWCDNDENQIADLYQLLILELVQLQRSIQVNNLLVNKGKDRVRCSIGILTGQSAAQNFKTYSSSGEASQPDDQRDIAVA